MPISLSEYIKQGSYLFLIALTVYFLYRYFIAKKIGLTSFSLILGAVMYSRQNISINLNSIWAEDGLYFADMKMEGFLSIFSKHNGYQQIAYRLIVYPATFLQIKLFPIYIMLVCFTIYSILIRELSKHLSLIPNPYLAPYAVFAFIWLPLSPYEALGNINNLATFLLIAFSLIHISICYRPEIKLIRYSIPTQVVALILGFSSPAFFIVIGLAFFLMILKRKSMPLASTIYLLMLSMYNFSQFIDLAESRFTFTFQMIPKLFLDSIFRLILSPIAGKVMPDLTNLILLSNLGLLLIFSVIFLNFFILLYLYRQKIFQKKSRLFDLFIALLTLIIPSLLAQLNAQSYLSITDLHYRWSLLAPGKFISISFFWIFAILVSSHYLFHVKTKIGEQNSNKESRRSLLLFYNTRILSVLSISGALLLVLLNSHSTGGRMPPHFFEDVSIAIRECNTERGLTVKDIPISPNDGNWKMRIRCELLN